MDEDEALAFWKQNWRMFVTYASTNQWLMMNGCDHQPVQRNLSEAIRVANRLFPDVTFIHSSFDEYMSKHWKVPFLNNYQRSQVS